MFRVRSLYYFPSKVRSICRQYSGKPAVGKKFTTLDEVREYLSRETWSISEYLCDDDTKKGDIPSKDTVLRLLKLSGLPIEGSDIEGIRQRLGKQLLLINKLHRIPLEDDSVDEMDACIMPRKPVPLTYEKLISAIGKQQKNPDTGEVDDSWDSTKLTSLQKDGFFVVRGGLLTNRD